MIQSCRSGIFHRARSSSSVLVRMVFLGSRETPELFPEPSQVDDMEEARGGERKEMRKELGRRQEEANAAQVPSLLRVPKVNSPTNPSTY